VRQVTAAVIIEGGRLLIARRPTGMPWQDCGSVRGKIEPGETPQACIGRELLEELGRAAFETRRRSGFVLHAHFWSNSTTR
jgi:8-oxo-dGTP pyrophosphatase MutT (NUDIX family)